MKIKNLLTIVSFVFFITTTLESQTVNVKEKWCNFKNAEDSARPG